MRDKLWIEDERHHYVQSKTPQFWCGMELCAGLRDVRSTYPHTKDAVTVTV